MRPARLLHPPEWCILLIATGLASICLFMALSRGVTLAFGGYAKPCAVATFLMGMGIAYRVTGRSRSISLALVATGLFVFSTLWLATLNYLLMPIGRPLIDPVLAAADGALGIRWSAVVEYVGSYPALNATLAVAYAATLPQVAVLIAVLGLTGQAKQLHEMCLTMVIATLGAVMFWHFFPSIGPTWLPAGDEGDTLGLGSSMLGPAWGREAYRVVMEGVSVLDPDRFEGMIAFPSIHTVLAVVLICFSRSMPWCFPVVLAFNILVFPAVIVHGGHHFVDIPAGFATFAIAFAVARTTLTSFGRWHRPAQAECSPATA